eukprot:5880650-Alexandrium_andersonii.AAC.1
MRTHTPHTRSFDTTHRAGPAGRTKKAFANAPERRKPQAGACSPFATGGLHDVVVPERAGG